MSKVESKPVDQTNGADKGDADTANDLRELAYLNLHGRLSDDQLAVKLGLAPKLVKRLKRGIGWGDKASNSQILLTTGGDDPIGKGDHIYVFLKKIHIHSLFSDAERESPDQQGRVNLNVNDQPSTVAWTRGKQSIGGPWETINDVEHRLLFAGATGEFLKLDLSLVESEDQERLVAQKIADALRIAAGIAGFVPGYGDAIGAGLSLGAAITDLIRAGMDDDSELNYLGVVGARNSLPFKTGDYKLVRKEVGAQDDIAIEFGVKKLSHAGNSKAKVAVFLDKVELNLTDKMDLDDQILLGATVTSTPYKKLGTEKPTVSSFEFQHPYTAKKEWPSDAKVPFESVVSITDQLLYEGEWGANLAFSLDISGIPKEFPHEEWIEILKQTESVVKAVTPDDANSDIEQGFAIAQSAAAMVVKYLPERLFSVSKTGLFVIDPNNGIENEVLFRVQEDAETSHEIELDLGKYGKAKLKLKVKTTIQEEEVTRRLPLKLFDKQTADAVSEPWRWAGGAGTIITYGTWGDATTIDIDVSPDPPGTAPANRSWFPMDPPLQFSENATKTFDHLSAGIYIRARLYDSDNSELTCVLA